MPRLMVPTSPIPVAERSMAMAPSFLFMTYSVTEDSADDVCDMAVVSPEFSPGVRDGPASLPGLARSGGPSQSYGASADRAAKSRAG